MRVRRNHNHAVSAAILQVGVQADASQRPAHLLRLHQVVATQVQLNAGARLRHTAVRRVRPGDLHERRFDRLGGRLNRHDRTRLDVERRPARDRGRIRVQAPGLDPILVGAHLEHAHRRLLLGGATVERRPRRTRRLLLILKAIARLRAGVRRIMPPGQNHRVVRREVHAVRRRLGSVRARQELHDVGRSRLRRLHRPADAHDAVLVSHVQARVAVLEERLLGLQRGLRNQRVTVVNIPPGRSIGSLILPRDQNVAVRVLLRPDVDRRGRSREHRLRLSISRTARAILRLHAVRVLMTGGHIEGRQGDRIFDRSDNFPVRGLIHPPLDHVVVDRVGLALGRRDPVHRDLGVADAGGVGDRRGVRNVDRTCRQRQVVLDRRVAAVPDRPQARADANRGLLTILQRDVEAPLA